MGEYLKPESYYNDRYDLFTIEDCLQTTENWKKVADRVDTKLTGEEKERGINLALNLKLYYLKGFRYQRRASTINEWMTDDRNRDEKLENTPEPHGGLCPICKGKMNVIHKQLHDWDKSPLRVLFMFECISCKKRNAIFEDGKEYVSKPRICPKCKNKLNISYKEKGRIAIWSEKCSVCDYSEIEKEDLFKKDKERKEREEKGQELLKKHRAEFCLSQAEGEEFNESLRRMDEIKEILDRAKQKQDDPDYQKVAKLNKWTIVELEKNLSATLEKEKYQKLMLEKPEIERYVIVPFTIQDANTSRKERDSELKLRRFIKKALEGTNWRLMSEGVNYRLGYLSGRLKGYEREEDLVEVIKSDGKSKQ